MCAGTEPPAWDFESELIAPELDRLMPWLEKAGERLPLFGRAGLKKVISGAITHTPDCNFLSGRRTVRPELLDALARRSASAKAAGPENIWRNGWSTARLKSICASSIRGGSAIGRARTIPRRCAIEDYHHMYYC